MPSAEVLLEHAEFLRRLARGILHDADAADDVAQDAVVAALGDRPKNLRAWLGRVARHLALSRRRAETRRGVRERAAAKPERLPSAAEGVARLELQRQVVDAVLALDEPYRSVVVHRFFCDFGPTEIAKRLGVPVGTVHTQLRRALDKLRARLDASHGRRSWSVALLAIAAPRKLPLGGILAMSAKTKLVAASVLVLGCAALGVSVLVRSDAPASRAPARGEARVEPEAVEPPPVVEVAPIDFATIDRDRDVHGVVVDPGGNPVAGADVRVVRYPAMGIGGLLTQAEAEEGPGTRTASDGMFTLRVERGEEVDLRVKADGFVPVQRRWCPAGGRVRVVMRTGVRLRVMAAAANGEPVPGVRLVLFKDPAVPEMETAGLYMCMEGMTDEHGAGLFEDLLPGHRILVIGWHPELEIEKPAGVDLPQSGEGEARLSAVRGADVTGRVTDAATGAPVAGVLVSSYPVPFPLAKHARTGPDGEYRYAGHNRWSDGGALFVHAPGYASAREVMDDRTRIDFALARGVKVTGVVRDALGAAVAGAVVAAEGLDAGFDLRETRSDANGRFEICDVRSDLEHVLVVVKPGYAQARIPIKAPELEVVLADPRRLEGRVLGFEGEPLGGLLVEMNRDPRSARKHERHTDDLGRFRFTDLSDGRYIVAVTDADRRCLEREVTLDASDVLDVEMRFERSRQFTVRVVDEGGQPVRNVLLTSGSVQKRTDADGSAVLEAPRGTDEVRVSVARCPDGFVRPPSQEWSGQGEMRIVLKEAATVSGRVLVDGEPLQAVLLMFSGPDGFEEATVTDKEGKFSRRVPAGGEVGIALTGQVGKLGPNGQDSEFLPIYGEESVAAGTTDVVLRARRVPLDRTLVVRVTGPDGTGVQGIQASVDARGYRSEKMPMTDANGRVELSGLPAGEIVVGISGNSPPPPWAKPKSNHARLVPNGQEVVFAFREAKPIRGVVLMPEGTGAETVVTAWRGKQEFVAQARSGSDGDFVLYVPADEPEPVRVEVRGSPFRGEVDGVLPGAEGVTIRLRAE